MINKRLLVKNLLAHNDENSFYDKKRFINIGQKEGKAKFLKHVCAMANSNPYNNSYIAIGVEDEDNTIVGVDFFDDSKNSRADLTNVDFSGWVDAAVEAKIERQLIGDLLQRTAKRCAVNEGCHGSLQLPAEQRPLSKVVTGAAATIH